MRSVDIGKVPQSVREKAARVKLLLMDVDGVLTEGKLYYFPSSDGKPMAVNIKPL